MTVVFLSIVLLMASNGIAIAQEQGAEYFDETGHWVTGEFLEYYHRATDPQMVYGYPLTEAMLSLQPQGVIVQYFQRARLEYHPGLAVGQRILLTPIGLLIYQPGLPSINLVTPGACRAFTTGFSVCYDFLLFFDRNGGAAQFGQPISAFEFLPDGRIVQYFERARFEWHPELRPGQNIKLTDLGRIYFDMLSENRAEMDAMLGMDGQIEVLRLRVLAYASKSVTKTTDTQTIFVIVQNQVFQPVRKVAVAVVIVFPSGATQSYTLTTDDHGIAVINDIQFADQPYGNLVQIYVNVQYLNLAEETNTSFRVWR